MESVRIDKWLWAARFFKTRSLARQAVEGGKVHYNGHRVKPSRGLQPGDILSITRGLERFEVTVLALAERRGSASVAQTLFQESENSRKRREDQAEQRRIERLAAPRGGERRPGKRDRREIMRFKSGDE